MVETIGCVVGVCMIYVGLFYDRGSGFLCSPRIVVGGWRYFAVIAFFRTMMRPKYELYRDAGGWIRTAWFGPFRLTVVGVNLEFTRARRWPDGDKIHG